MAKVYRTTNRVVIDPQSFLVSLDLSSPGAFLSTYRLLLDKSKPTRAKTLVITASRMMTEYMAALRELDIVRCGRPGGVLEWFGKCRQVAALKARVTRMKNRLLSWVSTTLAFFSCY